MDISVFSIYTIWASFREEFWSCNRTVDFGFLDSYNMWLMKGCGVLIKDFSLALHLIVSPAQVLPYIHVSKTVSLFFLCYSKTFEHRLPSCTSFVETNTKTSRFLNHSPCMSGSEGDCITWSVTIIWFQQFHSWSKFCYRTDRLLCRGGPFDKLFWNHLVQMLRNSWSRALRLTYDKNFQLLESRVYITMAIGTHVGFHKSIVTTISLNKCHVVRAKVLSKRRALVDILPNSARITRDREETYLLRLS